MLSNVFKQLFMTHSHSAVSIVWAILTPGRLTLTAGLCIDGTAWNELYRKERIATLPAVLSAAVSLLWVL